MYQKPAYADGVGGVQYAQRGVAEQGASQTSFLEPGIDGKAGEDGYWNRIRHVAPESSGRLRAGKRACRQRVVGNDTIFRADDERS